MEGSGKDIVRLQFVSLNKKQKYSIYSISIPHIMVWNYALVTCLGSVSKRVCEFKANSKQMV